MNTSRWWIASYIIVGILLGTGILFLVTRPPRGKPVVLLPPPTPAPIVVYISGAVVSPGMVNLPAGSRVNDAIQAAGGFTAEADASLLNLARYLQDGEHILVPSVNSPSAPDSDRSGIIPLSNQVDINSATLEQLDTLPEIGPITAQQIIDYRLNHGPFSSIEDIMKVSGIGQGIFDKIKDLITTVPVSP